MNSICQHLSPLYVISGFLITMILNERKHYRLVGNFFLSRYLQLWPVYAIVAPASIELQEVPYGHQARGPVCKTIHGWR